MGLYREFLKPNSWTKFWGLLALPQSICPVTKTRFLCSAPRLVFPTHHLVTVRIFLSETDHAEGSSPALFLTGVPFPLHCIRCTFVSCEGYTAWTRREVSESPFRPLRRLFPWNVRRPLIRPWLLWLAVLSLFFSPWNKNNFDFAFIMNFHNIASFCCYSFCWL